MTTQEIQTFVDNALSDYITHKVDAWTTAFKIVEMVKKERDTLQARVNELLESVDYISQRDLSERFIKSEARVKELEQLSPPWL